MFTSPVYNIDRTYVMQVDHLSGKVGESVREKSRN